MYYMNKAIFNMMPRSKTTKNNLKGLKRQKYNICLL